jgi:hypothetical protein
VGLVSLKVKINVTDVNNKRARKVIWSLWLSINIQKNDVVSSSNKHNPDAIFRMAWTDISKGP